LLRSADDWLVRFEQRDRERRCDLHRPGRTAMLPEMALPVRIY
jgi:hypothetical protein